MTAQAGDLTSGGILRKILMVALPIMGTQLLQMTYNLTDMFWLGRMQDSVTAVAASGLAGMFLWLGMALMLVGRVGSEVGVSQNLGAGNVAEARGYAQEGARLGLVLGIAYGLTLLLLAPQLLRLLQVQEQNVMDNASAYLRLSGLGVPFTCISMALTGAFNGAGKSHLGFWANAAGLITNMLLDPLMILGLGWGVPGAAVATLIAQAIVCSLLLLIAKRHPQRPFPHFQLLGRFHRERTGQVVRWSLPVALESGAFTALAMVVTGMVSSAYGANAVAVQRVGSQIESLSWLVGGGFSSAVAAFIGQNYGARKWTRIHRGYHISLGALLMWETAVMLLLIFGGRFLYSLFLREPQLQQMGREYLLILSGCQIFMGLEGVCAGAFRGMGRTLPPSISSILSNLLRPLMCWALAQHMGLNGFWLGISLSAVLRGSMIFIWFTLQRRHMPREDGAAAPLPRAAAG